MSSSSRPHIIETQPQAAIQFGLEAEQQRIAPARWGLFLVVFMRVIAALWIEQGLLQWQSLLTSGTQLFDNLPPQLSFSTVFFAVSDLIAATGLWLAVPWGGVLWLMSAASQMLVAVLIPEFFASRYIVIAINLALIFLYFFISIQAAREKTA